MHVITEHEAADLAELFRTLGDASRIQIEGLAGDRCKACSAESIAET